MQIFWQQYNRSDLPPSKVAQYNFIPILLLLLLKGPAAEATDAPQPWDLLCNPVMKMISFFFVLLVMERRWNDTDRGKPKYWGKNLSQCHFVHHKSHMIIAILVTRPVMRSDNKTDSSSFKTFHRWRHLLYIRHHSIDYTSGIPPFLFAYPHI
jgi:hypothetical protein